MNSARIHQQSRPAHSELEALLARLASGERSAFQPTFEALWPLLRRFCTRLLDGEADGDDAAQQALLKIFSHARDYDPSRAALPWILTIATNECRTLRKKRTRRREVGGEQMELLTERQPSPEQALIGRDLETALADVFAELRPEDLHTLALAVTYDRGERPPIPAATFRKRVERAMERLRLAWRAKHGTL